MIKYDEVLKNQDRLGPFLSKEKTLVNNLRVSQDTLKKYIHTYIDQINATFANEEVFQNMLLASLQTALLQIDINIQDLINLSNIIDILKKEGLYSIEESITQYNKLYDKVEKNISIVREILQKTINSFDQLSAISSNSNLTTIDEQKLNEAKQAIIGSTEDLFPKEKKVERNIKPSDFAPHVDDLGVAITLMAKESPFSSFIQRVVPAFLCVPGYETGLHREEPEIPELKK